jgi:hypothetical protein
MANFVTNQVVRVHVVCKQCNRRPRDDRSEGWLRNQDASCIEQLLHGERVAEVPSCSCTDSARNALMQMMHGACRYRLMERLRATAGNVTRQLRRPLSFTAHLCHCARTSMLPAAGDCLAAQQEHHEDVAVLVVDVQATSASAAACLPASVLSCYDRYYSVREYIPAVCYPALS